MMGFSTQMMQLIQGIVFLIFVAVFAATGIVVCGRKARKN